MFTGRGRKKSSRYGSKVRPLSPWQAWSGWARGERPWASTYVGRGRPLRGGAALAAWLETGVSEGRNHNGAISPKAVSLEFSVWGGLFSKLRYLHVDGKQFVVLRFFGMSYAKEIPQTGTAGSQGKPGQWWGDEDFAVTSRTGGGPGRTGARKGR
jgi:hypothetical protein